jgi:NAD(P)-dependent dehydrogenase (short-subunit alcohol dehydrogenase family)
MMMTDTHAFAGKTVLVTGAGHGIGRAVAERFSSHGACVVVNDLDASRAADVVATLPAERTMAYPADVSDKAQVDAMFAATIECFGTVDILVNNAGNIHATRHFLEMDETSWDKMLGVNLKGAFLCSHRASVDMARRGSGNIINMSSGGATKAHRGNVAYDASKGGIEAMTRAMALDLAPYGIRVNAVVPGLILTYDLMDAEAVERGAVVPMGRLGTPEDIAGPTVFLATDDARYITGSCLVVDGGVLVQQRSAPVDTFPLSRFPKIV